MPEPLQVPYQSASQGRPLKSLVPANMANPIQNALNRLQDKHGNVDEFVASRLQWSQDELFDRLSAEQIDAVALALDNRAQNAETILGDQTGVGKGRVVACMIRAAKLEGQTPIFVTENANLYRDLLRDLNDIGEEVNPYFTDSQLDLETLNGTRIKYSAPQHQQEETQILNQNDLGERDCIFTTYSQMQTVRGTEPNRRHILRQFAPNATLIFDESHNAGGSGDGLNYHNSVPNRAAFTRELKRSAQDVFSSSATYAKRPEVMDLYNRTDMGKAVENINSLVEIVQEGGVPLQQALASQLSEAGQYIRRERSYEGVDFDNQIFPIDREIANDEARAMQAILQFDQAKVEAVEGLDKELKQEAKALLRDNSTGYAGAESANFTSLMHNYLSVSNLAHKEKGVVDLALNSLENSEKPIVALSNTMESFVAQYARENGLQPGDPIDATFGDLLERYLERSRDVLVRNSRGQSERRRLSDEELGTGGVDAYEDALEAINQCDLSSLPISPIDAIRFELEEQGYTTGEITGRSERVRYERDPDSGQLVGSYDRRSASERSKAGKAQAVDGFNSGEMDALILNRSGATGISLHASEKFSDQRRRHLIVAQPESDVNKAVQMFGRVHRTGQVQPPKITIGAGENPSEKRSMAVLMKKLASLNANTTASREGQIEFSNATDFLNELGDRTVAEIVEEDEDLEYRLDFPLTGELEGTARRVTGRMAVLPLQEQEELMARIESEYLATLEREIAMGNNPLEAEKLDLDARTVASVEVQPADAQSESPFTDAVVFSVLDVKQNRQPPTTLEAMNAVRHRLGLDPMEEVSEFDPEQISVRSAEMGEGLKQQIQERTEDWLQEREGLFKTDDAQQRFHAKIDTQSAFLQEKIEDLPIGQTVRIRDPKNDILYGVVVDHRSQPSTQNPVSPSSWNVEVMVASPARNLKIPYSQIGQHEGKYEFEPQAIEEFEGKEIYSLFDERQGTGRELRGMFTGNLVRAAEKYLPDGKVVNYTNEQGEIHQGILVDKKFDLRQRLEKMPVKMPSSEAVREFTTDYQRPVQSRNGNLTLEFNQETESFKMMTPKSKTAGGEYFLDPKLLEAAGGGEFHSVANRMELDFEPQQLEDVWNRLSQKGGLYAAGEDVDLAREMLDVALPDFSVLDGERLEQARAQLEEVFANSPDENGVTVVEELEEVEETKRSELEETDVNEAGKSSQIDAPKTTELEEIDRAEAEQWKEAEESQATELEETHVRQEPLNTSPLQQQRVEQVAPILERYLSGFAEQTGSEPICARGKNYTLACDRAMQHFTLSDNHQNDRVVLSAVRHDDGMWEDRGSELSFEEVKHFTQNVAPAVEKQLAHKQKTDRKIEQQRRVEAIAPTLVKYLKLANRLSIEGQKFTSALDPQSATLTLCRRSEEQPCLVAKYDENGRWRDRGSAIDEGTLRFFEQEVNPKVEAALEQRERKQQAQQGKQEELARSH